VLTVVETPLFQTYAAKVWSDSECDDFIDWIALNPMAGDVIPGAGGLRKVRWGRAGIGKRGGARVIYFHRTARGDLVLIVVYAKAKFDNLPNEVLLQWKKEIDNGQRN
jgi:hypothetical protein